MLGFEAEHSVLSSAFISGDGALTIRLFEDEGRADEIVLRAPFQPARATLTNLDGDVLGEAKIDGETVRFPVEAYRIAQVKLYR